MQRLPYVIVEVTFNEGWRVRNRAENTLSKAKTPSAEHPHAPK